MRENMKKSKTKVDEFAQESEVVVANHGKVDAWSNNKSSFSRASTRKERIKKEKRKQERYTKKERKSKEKNQVQERKS